MNYQYTPHPRIAERRKHGPPKVHDQLRKGNAYERINARLAVVITVGVGSMSAAYVFFLISLISAPDAFRSHNTIIMVSWISQSFLQLVLLPVIIVGQNIQGRAADKRAEETYKDAEAVLHEAIEIQAHLKEQDEVLERLVAEAKS